VSEYSAERCQEILGYRFEDPSWLAHALLHASVAPTRRESNERLEFLGDAVLGLSVCSELHSAYEDLLEGEMTKIKSSVVSRRTCAVIARATGMADMLSISGDMAGAGQLPDSVAAAVFEAVVGAIYMDGGFQAANDFVLEHMRPMIEEALATGHQKNFKSLLQQHAQRKWAATPDYLLLDEQGPDHSKCFEIAVSLDGRHFPSAWGRNKKDAEQAAARRALVELGVLKEKEETPEDPSAETAPAEPPEDEPETTDEE
jgi:ribonuclease-3